MKNDKKILRMIYFMILVILFLLLILKYIWASYCDVFKHPFKGNKYGEMVRQVQLIQCGVKPTIPITKKIYYNDEFVGAISNDILILKGTSTLEGFYKLPITKKYIEDKGGIFVGENSICDGIKSQLKDMNINYITGWSLGAMIGMKVSLWIFETTGRKTKNVFFGLPPIADETYKNTFNKHLYDTTVVYNNKNDPAAWPIIGKNGPYDKVSKKLNLYHVGQVKLDYPYNDYSKKFWFYPVAQHMSYF